MYFTPRERKILDFLILYGEASLKDFISYFNISDRTLRRSIQSINDSIMSLSLEIIIRNNKLYLIGDNKEKNKLGEQLNATNEFSSIEIKCLILQNLFYEDRMSLLELSNLINTTARTININLEEIRENNKETFNFSLEKGKGIEVRSSEISKRKLLSKYLYQLSVGHLSDFIKGFHSNEISIKNQVVTECLNLKLLHKVEKVFRKEQETLLNEKKISDDDYLRILLYFSISFDRLLKGHWIDSQVAGEYKGINHEIYLFVEQIFKILSVDDARIEKEIPSFIRFYLNVVGQKLGGKVEAEYLAEQLIKRIEKEYRIQLTSQSLKNDLTLHLKNSQKLKFYGSTFYEKKLITQIKNEYIDLYKIIENELLKFFSTNEVTEEQIVYIVLHFGVELINLSAIQTRNILVVCSSGMGSSKMMSAILKRELEHVKLDTTSVYKLFNEVDLTKYDLIVSTINLGEILFPYIVVSPIITKEQITDIKTKLNELRKVEENE